MEATENLNKLNVKRENMDKELKSRLSLGFLALGIFLVMLGFYLLAQNKTAAGLILAGFGVFIIGARYG